MSDLERALEWWESTPQFNHHIGRLADAARRFVNLTSDETVGTIAGASVVSQEFTEVLIWLPREYAAELVRSGDKVAVLRSVEEGTQ